MRYLFQIFVCIILSVSFKFQALAQFIETQGKGRGLYTEYHRMVKHLKYKMKEPEFTYRVYMKDGSLINANSNIFKDNVSGNHFLYSSEGDSVIRIFPTQTIKIVRNDPYNVGEIEGVAIECRYFVKKKKG